MRHYGILTAICMTLLLVSCEKELDIKYHDIEPIPVIEAELTQSGAKVSITYTTPMDEPMDRTRITDAEISLTDLTNGKVYYLHTDPEGFFIDPNPGVVGHDYRLIVERSGCRYESETTMYGPVEIKSLDFNWIKMPYDDVAVLQGKFYDNNSSVDVCYWVKLYRNGKIYKWSEMDSRSAVDGVSTYFTMTTRKDTDKEEDDDVLLNGDVVTFSVGAITRTMHDYLEAIQNDSNGPAMFTGSKCLGYFIATTPVAESIVFHPDEIPEYE